MDTLLSSLPPHIQAALDGQDHARIRSAELHGPTAPPADVRALARETVRGIRNALLHGAEYNRSECLWPTHYEVFATGPLGLEHGATGSALLLHSVDGALPGPLTEWFRAQPLDGRGSAPGLLTGLSGVALAYQHLGLTDLAADAMAAAYASPVLLSRPGFGDGVAGWGFASLALYRATGDDTYLQRAAQAADHLEGTALHVEDTTYWVDSDAANTDTGPAVNLGWAHGASGVALFYTSLFEVTGDRDLLRRASQAVDHDLAHAVVGPNRIAWGRKVNDSMTLPYWSQGATGIGRVLLRLDRHLDHGAYGEVADLIARSSANVKMTVLPSLFMGMSGLGDYLLDVADAAPSPQDADAFRRKALDLAESVLWFRLKVDGRVVYPCRLQQRIDLSLGTGAAGVGLFLHRLDGGDGARLLLDLPTPA